MEVQIRRATKDDYTEVISLYGNFVNDPERYKVLDNDSYLKFIETPNSFMDLVISGEKIIGFITYAVRTVVRYPKPILEVEELYVHPDYRRHGLGKKLMEHVLEFAKSVQCQYIFLASDKARKEAHEFYKALGFDQYAYHFRLKI